MNKKYTNLHGWFSLLFLFVLFLFGTSQKIYAVIIYDNGPLATGPTSNSGVSAPTGTQWSEAQNDFGVTNYANTVAGFACSVTTTVFRCADDFNVPAGQTWTINQVIVFAYQTGYTGSTSPITGATLQIWQGRPGDTGSTVIFGDTTTNRFASSTNSNLYRIFNSVVGSGPTPPTAPGTTRIIWQVNINVSPAVVLPPGNYWISWNTQIGTTTAHFAPASTIVGTRNVPFSNARQFNGTSWVDASDTGQTPTGNPTPIPLRQEFPFKLDGTISGAPLAPRSRTIDFNGDNRTDFAIVRAASVATQSNWWVQLNGGASYVTSWGLGTGLSGGDIPTPADFDGDGKTDVAVWRPGPPNVAAFYILNSSTNTTSVQLFGQTGDDPTIVGDYDGDGKADVAVYRNGTGGGQSTFFYRGSFSNPSGNISYIPWGVSGDVPIPGDFNGDGKFDFHAARNISGQMTHYRLLSGGGVVIFPFGLNTDRFITGDFDADGRTDVAAVRANAGNFDWYFFRSSDGVIAFEKFGNPTTDYLAPGDYDGDNKTDLAVWRSGQGPNDTYFYLRNTFASPFQAEWGQSAGTLTPPDYPVANFSVK